MYHMNNAAQRAREWVWQGKRVYLPRRRVQGHTVDAFSLLGAHTVTYIGIYGERGGEGEREVRGKV